MSTAPAPPRFSSLAFEDVPRPDFADVLVVPLPEGASTDPAVWARAVFDVEESPAWVRAAFAVRQVLSPLIGVPRGDATVFGVARVSGEEALIVVDDRHLDFRCAVGVDVTARLVRVTTVVRLHGWRGRVYFAPVQIAHGPVLLAMLRRAARAQERGSRTSKVVPV